MHHGLTWAHTRFTYSNFKKPKKMDKTDSIKKRARIAGLLSLGLMLF